MRRWLWLTLVGLVSATACFGQSSSNESQTLQALLEEVRLLRRDLLTTTAATQRAQILLFRLQVQQAVVSRLTDKMDEKKAALSRAQSGHQRMTTFAKQLEDNLANATDETKRQQLEQQLQEIKRQQEAMGNQEQEAQTAVLDFEEQVRTEQAKLSALQEQLDGIEKSLTNTGKP